MTQDDRFRNFSLVVNVLLHNAADNAPGLRSWDNLRAGHASTLSFAQQEGLRRLAQQLVGLLEHRRRVIELDKAMRELDAAHAALAAEKAKTENLLTRILRPKPLPTNSSGMAL
jgi:hypothetical protein